MDITTYLDEYDNKPVHITGKVKEKIDQVKETSRELYAEQDLFLCGRIGKEESFIDGYLDPSHVFDEQLIISFERQEYKPEMCEEIESLAKILTQVGIPKKGVYGTLVMKTLDFFDKKKALKIMQEMPATYFLRTGSEDMGLERTSPKEILSNPNQDIYAPQAIFHETLLNSPNNENSKMIDNLKQNNVCGYFHTHQYDDRPITNLSVGDIFTGKKLKSFLNQKRFLLGTSNDFTGDQYETV